MKALWFYRITRLALLAFIAAGLLIFLLVRAPEGTASDRILRDVAMVGRIDGMVGEMVGAVRVLAAALEHQPGSELRAARDSLDTLRMAASRLQQDVEALWDDPATWIPVAEAAELLAESHELSQEALDRTVSLLPRVPEFETSSEPAPAPEPSSDPGPESDPNANSELAHSPTDMAQILNARAHQLLEASHRVEARSEQAIMEGLLARGMLWRLDTAQWLLVALSLCGLFGMLALSHAIRRVQVPPERLERMELELIGRTDRQAAVQRCHERVRGLLDLADGLCRERRN